MYIHMYLHMYVVLCVCACVFNCVCCFAQLTFAMSLCMSHVRNVVLHVSLLLFFCCLFGVRVYSTYRGEGSRFSFFRAEAGSHTINPKSYQILTGSGVNREFTCPLA